jgi:hypothetical protein
MNIEQWWNCTDREEIEVFGREDCPVCTSTIASKTVGGIKKLKVNVKVKFTLEQATKAQRGSTDMALLFL